MIFQHMDTFFEFLNGKKLLYRRLKHLRLEFALLATFHALDLQIFLPSSTCFCFVLSLLRWEFDIAFPSLLFVFHIFSKAKATSNKCVHHYRHQGINKRSEFGLHTGTDVFKTVFFKGTFRAQTGTIVHSRNVLVLFRP